MVYASFLDKKHLGRFLVMTAAALATAPTCLQVEHHTPGLETFTSYATSEVFSRSLCQTRARYFRCTLFARGRRVSGQVGAGIAISKLKDSAPRLAPSNSKDPPTSNTAAFEEMILAFQNSVEMLKGMKPVMVFQPNIGSTTIVGGIAVAAALWIGSLTTSASLFNMDAPRYAAGSYVQSMSTSRSADDGAGNVVQIYQVTRMTQTGAPIELLSKAVQNLDSNRARSEVTEQLLDELGAAETPQRSNTLARLIWKAWFYHENQLVVDLMREGNELMNEGDYAEAEWRFQNARDFDRSYAEAWNRLATLHYLTGDYGKSLDEIRQTLELEPRHFGAISGRGLVLSKMERFTEAAQSFREVGGVEPAMADKYDQKADLAMASELKRISQFQ